MTLTLLPEHEDYLNYMIIVRFLENLNEFNNGEPLQRAKEALVSLGKSPPDPIDILLWCPNCGERHIDRGEFETKPHYSHACQACGLVWRPAIVSTRGVQFLPGFRNDTQEKKNG